MSSSAALTCISTFTSLVDEEAQKRRTSTNSNIHQQAHCRFLRWPIVDMNVVPEGLYVLYSTPSNHSNTIFVYSWTRKAALISRFILLQKLDKYSRKLTGNIMHLYPRSELLEYFVTRTAIVLFCGWRNLVALQTRRRLVRVSNM